MEKKVEVIRVPFKKCLECSIFNKEAENKYDCHRHPDCPANREVKVVLRIGVDPQIIIRRLSGGLLGGLLEEDKAAIMDALKKARKHKILPEVLKTFALQYYIEVIKPYEAFQEETSPNEEIEVEQEVKQQETSVVESPPMAVPEKVLTPNNQESNQDKEENHQD